MMMNKPLEIANKPFRVMKTNTSKERNFYTQGQQFTARVLFIVWLLASGSPEDALAVPKRQMTPVTMTSPGDPSLASAPPTPLPGGALELSPDSPGVFWGDNAGSSPSIGTALQERMSQEDVPDKGRELLRTFPGANPVSEHLPFEARGGESVRFHYQMGQWRAEVLSRIGSASRRALLPVVCSQGEDVASSLEVLSKYPSWYSQRQIHVLGRNVCPTFGEVVYVGELGLKGGGEGEASGSGEVKDAAPAAGQIPTSPQPSASQHKADDPLVKELRALASDPQLDQQPDKLAELGAVLLKLAASKQEEAGTSSQDLSTYTEAAILYQHVLSICEQKAGILDSQEAPTLEQSAYQGLAQIQASMLAQAKGAAPITAEEVQARIRADKQSLEATRTKAREEAERLAEFRDKQGSAEEVLAAEAVYIEGSKKLFADIAEASKKLLANFYQAGEQALGPPPCKYAIMGVGSIALQQTTPYSDLEFAILMEDAPDDATAEAWRAYFRKLTHLVHFRVINLGETVLPFSEYEISLDHLGRKGLNFDLGGKTPLGRKDKDYELIQPVEGMMKYLKNEDNKMEQMDKLLPFVLERTCYIYGDQGLHNDYLASQRAFWSSCQDAAGKHAYQERMRKKLLEGVSELDHSQPGVVRKGREQPGDLRTVGPKLHPEDAGRLYDVKQEIYRLPDRLLYGLATYYGLRPESAWDAVEQLKAQGIIGVSEEAKQAAHRLQYAVSFATMLRLATYIRYGEQKEALAAGSASSEQIVSELFALPKEALQENGSLFKYYYTALALHSEMEEFFELLNLRLHIQTNRALCRTLTAFRAGGKYTAGQEKAHFCSSQFYDTSCAVKIAIYNRLLQYEQAAKCAEDHLEQVKAGYNKKKLARAHHNLGVTYYHLGKFDQSFDHFKISLERLKELYRAGDPQVAVVLRSLGIAHYNLSEFEESLKHFKQSLEMLQGLYRENNPETAQALGSVGAAYEQLSKFQESLKHKEDALKMLQGLYPDKDPEVARALLSLGDAYAATGQLAVSQDQKEDSLSKFHQSLEHKQSALEMFKALYGKSHPEVAHALLSLGESYALDGKLAASLEHKQKALAMFQDLYGSSHPEVARALLSVGESYEAMGDLTKSKEYKNKSVVMFKKFYKDTHSEVSQARESLSRTKSARISALEGGNPVHTSAPLLCPVRTSHPQHLALLSTPRHGKEAAGENTLLRDYYQDPTFACVPSLFEEQRSKHVKDLQCQLMLREKKRIKEDGKIEEAGDSNEENQFVSHHMRIEEVKTPITLQDLFKDRSVHPDKPVQAVQRILLTGDPGTGKTTVSKKLAYQWAKGAWGQEFHTLYLLPVRSLQQSEYDGTRYNRERTLATAIVNNCFVHDLPTIEAEYNRLREHIEQELKRSTTLVILDGLDERAGASEQILSQAQDQSAPHKLLMLSRPYGIDTERRLANIEIDHRGFNDEQLKAYVREEVSDGELAAALLAYIHQHANIREVAHVPVNLQILCALWQDKSYRAGKEELQQGSLPGLYRLFTEFTWQRYTKKWGLADENEEEVFDTLGQIALEALAQGEVLISPGLVHHQVKHVKRGKDKLKARLKDAGFLLLSYVGQDQDKQGDPANQSGFYQFPHLTFQEYFAGRTLARQFLSKDEDEQECASDFLSEYKYEGQYGRMLSFMAGEVSRGKGAKGIKKLLSLLEDRGKEIVGVQHLCLQLRVIHEWLCVAKEREADKGMAELEDKFQMMSSLEEWFGRAFAHVRLEYGHNSTGRKLLELLTGSLQTFGSVASHAPDLFELLKQGAEDKSDNVREASLKALSTLLQASPALAQESFPLLEKALKDETDYVRKAVLEALCLLIEVSGRQAEEALPLIQTVLKDTSVSVRAASQEALSTLLEASPGQAPAALPSILEALKDTSEHVREAAQEALSTLLQASPELAQEALSSILEAAKDKDSEDEDSDVCQAALESLSSSSTREAAKDEKWRIRQAPLEALSSLLQASTALAKEAFPVLLEAAKDEAWEIRQAARETLSSLLQASPELAKEALPSILEAAKDEAWRVRQASLEVFLSLVQTSPEQAQEVFPILLEAAKDEKWRIRQAALKALSTLLQISPEQAQEALPIILDALKDKDSHVVRQAQKVFPALFKASPGQAQTALLSTLEAAEDKDSEDEDSDVRQAALEALSSLLQASPELAKEALPSILEAAKDENRRVCQAARETLSSLLQASPELAQEALPSILEGFKDDDPGVLEAALKALSSLLQASPELAKEALPSILEGFKDDDPGVLEAALKALSSLLQASPELAKEALPSILEGFKDDDPGVLEAALKALSSLLQASPELAKEALPSILEALKDDENFDVCQAALEALSSLLQASPELAKEALPSILEAAKDKVSEDEDSEDENSHVREAALKALSSLLQASPELAQEALPSILEALKDEDSDICEAALEALSSLVQSSPELAQEALPSILEAAKDKVSEDKVSEDEDSHVREAALKALSSLLQASPELAQEALPSILEALKDEDSDICEAALEALSSLVQSSPELAQEALPSILEGFKDENSDICEAALEALSSLVQSSPALAQGALPSILEGFKDENSDICEAALEALSSLLEVDPTLAPEALPSILEAAKDKDKNKYVRQAALKALSSLLQASPELTQEAFPIILKATKNENSNVRSAAREALSSLLQASLELAKEALPNVLAAAKNKDSDVRQAALKVLSSLLQASPELAKEALPNILAAAKDENEYVRQAALEALSSLVQSSPALAQEALPNILEALKDEDPDVHQAAREALSSLVQVSPERAQEPLSRILKAAKDENEYVCQAARGALVQASLEQLLEGYWSSKDAILIPYITPRLYETPLVVGEGRRGLQQVTLYATAGNPREWKEPQEAVDHFKKLVKTEARKIEGETTNYGQYGGCRSMVRTCGSVTSAMWVLHLPYQQI